jgi:hypothetical protein
MCQYKTHEIKILIESHPAHVPQSHTSTYELGYCGMVTTGGRDGGTIRNAEQ